MKSRYLLGAGAAFAVALGGAQANAQFAFLGGPYPVSYYIGPEGGWTSLSDQKNQVATPAFTVNNGPLVNNFQFNSKYDSGYNVGARAGIQWGRCASKKNTATGTAGCPISAERAPGTIICSRGIGPATP